MVISILVALAPLLLLVSLPTFAVAVWFGGWGRRKGKSHSGTSVGFFVAGALGFLLDAAAIAFALFDDPHGRFMDSIDSGLLTGVPTVFVIFVSIYTLAVMAVVVGRLLFGSCSFGGVRVRRNE